MPIQMVSVEKIGKKLRLTLLPEARDDIELGKTHLSDVIEHQLCNGWQWVNPEEIGALTEAPIITDDYEWDEHGNLTHCGSVYAYMDYMLYDPVDELVKNGYIELIRIELTRFE